MNNGAGAALAAKVQQKIGINKKIQANICFAWIFVFYSCLAGILYFNIHVR